MKHVLTTIIFLFSITALLQTSFAQLPGPGNASWMTKWEKKQPLSDNPSNPDNWMYGDGKYTGIAHDNTRGLIYVISPGPYTDDGVLHNTPRIFAFDAASGMTATQIRIPELAPPGQVFVDTTIIEGGLENGKFALYKIAVDDEGRIYACNAVSPSLDPTTPFRIYRWDTPTSIPELVYEALGDTALELIGTAFTVAGKRHSINNTLQDSVRIFVSTAAFYKDSAKDGELHILAADRRVNKPYDYRLMQIIRNPDPGTKFFGAGVAATGVHAVSDVYVAAPGGIVRRIRQGFEGQTLPFIHDADVFHSVPYSSGNGVGGPLAIIPGFFPYLAIGKMVPSTTNPQVQNLNTSVNAFIVDQSVSLRPIESTPKLGIKIPSLIAGDQSWIADVSRSVYLDQESGRSYQEVYYLLSNNGIAAYRDRFPMFVPVELASFNAAALPNAIHITWSTATETNNYGFEVERNIHGSVWESIAFVAGQGTTMQAVDYIYTDPLTQAHHNAGLVRYRLKQVDYDGTFEYSPIVEAQLSNTAESITLSQNYPNPVPASTPVTEIAYRLSHPGYATLKVYNMLGVEVATLQDGWQNAGSNTVSVNIAQLSRGAYCYRLRSQGVVLQKMMLVR